MQLGRKFQIYQMDNFKIFLVIYSTFILSKITANENIIGDDNNKETVAPSNECRPTLDVIFLLDTSHSVKDIFKEQVQWANALVSLLPVARDGVHVGAIQYAGLPMVEFALNTYTTAKDVQDHMKNIEHRSGVTRTGAALRKAKEEFYNPLRGGRLFARKLVVLMTDGVSIDEPQTMAEQMRKENNITIITVALAKDPYLPELSAITGNESLCFRSSDLISLKAHILDILKDILNKCGLEKGDALSTTATITATPTSTSTTSATTTTTATTATATTATTSSTTTTTSTTKTATNATTTGTSAASISTSSDTTSDRKPDSSTRSTLETEYLSYGTTLTAQLATKSASDKSTLSFATTQNGAYLETINAKTLITNGIQQGPLQINSTQPESTTQQSASTATTQQSITLNNNIVLSHFETPTVPVYSTTATTKVASKPLLRAKFARKCVLPQLDSISESLDPSNCLDGEPTTRNIVVDESIPLKNFTIIDSTKLDLKPFEIVQNSAISELCPLNILFMLDSSSSMAEEFYNQKQIIKDIIDLLTLDPKYHRIAMMQFSGYLMQQPVVSFDPYQSNYFINDAIDNLQQLSGTSYIGAALTFVRNMLYRRREDTKTILILVSDGFSQDDAVQPAEILKTFYNADIYAMTVSKEHDRSYLSRITGSFDNVFIGDYQLQYFKESFKKKLVNCSFHN